MSIRKQYQKRLQPIINAIDASLELSSKEAVTQQQINRCIIEELLQTDAISKIQSLSALKLIIYELILIFYQQNGKKTQQNDENGSPQNRISNLLWAIKQILRELVEQNVDYESKVMGRRSQRQSLMEDKTFKNKFKIFTSYFNQYCGMVDQRDNKIKSIPPTITCQPKQQALINQLQNLVYKKQQIIKFAKADKLILQNNIKNIEQRFTDLQKDLIVLNEQNKKIISQNQSLRQEIKSLMERSITTEPQIDMDNQTAPLKSIWSESINKIQQPEIQDCQNSQSEMLKFIVSQAQTIQALITG